MRLKTIFLTPLLWIISHLPLSMLRAIGGGLGVVVMKIAKRSGMRLRSNLLITNVANQDNIDRLAKESAAEMGKTLLEAIAIAWGRCKKYNNSLVLHKINFAMVQQESLKGKPLVFLTPHIGNFEIAIKATAYELSQKFTILYKPIKPKWINDWIYNGRLEDNIQPVPTNRRGVAALFKALQRNEFIGILPDSVASQGDGVWADFFGHKVFATTLAAKFILLSNVSTFFVASRRVKSGFTIEYIPFAPQSNEVKSVVQEIYNMIEKLVLRDPTQYYWSYDRFRIPRSNLRSLEPPVNTANRDIL